MEWIKAENRLPETSRLVLIFIYGKSRIGYLDYRENWSSEIMGDWCVPLTHGRYWMPLPEPPTE